MLRYCPGKAGKATGRDRKFVIGTFSMLGLACLRTSNSIVLSRFKSIYAIYWVEAEGSISDQFCPEQLHNEKIFILSSLYYMCRCHNICVKSN
jgi:hypothetical protein